MGSELLLINILRIQKYIHNFVYLCKLNIIVLCVVKTLFFLFIACIILNKYIIYIYICNILYQPIQPSGDLIGLLHCIIIKNNVLLIFNIEYFKL
jgi:hypothetical protein